MLKKCISGFILLLTSSIYSSKNVYVSYNEAARSITSKILENTDLSVFSQSLCIENIESFFENIILASYAITKRNKDLLDTTLKNFIPLFEKPQILNDCVKSFRKLFKNKKYPHHLSLAAIRSHSNEIRIFILLCKKMPDITSLNYTQELDTLIKNYKNDIIIAKQSRSESAYDNRIGILIK